MLGPKLEGVRVAEHAPEVRDGARRPVLAAVRVEAREDVFARGHGGGGRLALLERRTGCWVKRVPDAVAEEAKAKAEAEAEAEVEARARAEAAAEAARPRLRPRPRPRLRLRLRTTCASRVALLIVERASGSPVRPWCDPFMRSHIEPSPQRELRAICCATCRSAIDAMRAAGLPCRLRRVRASCLKRRLARGGKPGAFLLFSPLSEGNILNTHFTTPMSVCTLSPRTPQMHPIHKRGLLRPG